MPSSRKEVALAPPRAMALMVAVTVPVFLTVTICASLVEPTMVLANAMEVGVRVTVGVAEVAPVPVRATVCGVPVALSAIDRLAFNAPVAAGLNATETVQMAPAASDVPQVVADLRNEVGFVPVMVSEDRVTVPVPVFLMVTSWAAVVVPTLVEAKVSEVGESETVKVGPAAPVPVRATVCGDPVALSAMERLAVSVPATAGLNSTETVQVALTASEAVQVLAEMR